jgi:hypothetical protein
MNPRPGNFCATCSAPLLAAWKGWPLRDPIPHLPRIVDATCGACGGSKTLQSERIHWLNYHGRYNTGLPDYWLLVTDQETSWGAPYFGDVPCLKCGKSAVLSQHGDTRSQRFEYKINCFSCGLVRPLPGKSPATR